MRTRRTRTSLPSMLFSLGVASAETIARRTTMMVSGTCSASEYRRMVQEKAKAAAQSAALLGRWPAVRPTTLLAPWHGKARANARRLAKRRSSKA